MRLTSDELLHHLHATDAAFADAAADAPVPGVRDDVLRRIDHQARSLRALLEGDAVTVLADAVEAARGLLEADPVPGDGLSRLDAARHTLHAVIHRQAERLRLDAAA